MATKRKKYYRTKDVSEIYGCTQNDVRKAVADGLLKAHQRSKKWYIPMDQPEAFAEFRKRVNAIERRSPVQIVPETQEAPQTNEPEYTEDGRQIFHLSNGLTICTVKPVKKVKTVQPALKRPIGFQYMADKEISSILLPEILNAKRSIKIATSNFKNLYVDGESIFAILERKVQEGVKIQIICMDINNAASEGMKSYPKLLENKNLFKLKICPRNHMKMFAYDWNTVYLGSANLTNAAMGSRSQTHMNYENGIITDDQHIVVNAIGHFDRVWQASACEGCKSKLCDKNQ